MLLIDPAKAALAIGAKCNGQSPASDNAQLVLILKYMTPRIEDAMNIASIVRGSFVDSFYLPLMNPRADRPIARLRLSNGLLLAGGTVTIQDELGNAVVPARIDENYGIIEIESWDKGVHTVAYTSGLEVPPDPTTPPTDYDPETKVLIGVPVWIEALVIDCLVAWFRATPFVPKLPQNLNLGALDAMLRKEIYLRLYGRYDRPRVNCFFPESMSRAA